jgi:peptidoglycan hydrolase-like protein with peptidoglycan-binding domain
MSYAMNGMGAYYEFTPHEVYSGYGAVDAFSADAVWADAQYWDTAQAEKSSAGCDAAPGQPLCAQLDSQANAASRRVAIAVQEALNALNYPVAVDGAWGSETSGAWAKFTGDEGLPSGPGLVNKPGLDRMEGRLTGSAQAGLGTLGWGLLLIGLGAVGYGLVKGRKRRSAATGRVMMR